jgi:DHA2 family multidrug resistance protein-like MFS transporter
VLALIQKGRPVNPVSPLKATSRDWIGLTVLALPCVLYSMDLTVLNLAVPHLTADLKPSAAQLLWIVDIYGFIVAGALLVMGTLGDRIGRRRLLLIGAAAFGAASVLAAFAPTANTLIAARALLGIAAATFAPSTLSLIRNMFHDPEERTFAIGMWATSYSVGAAIGPLLGGVLLEYFWWGSVFLLAVPVMVLLLAVGPTLLPEYRDPQAGRMDIASAALSLAAVLTIIFGLKSMAENGPSLAMVGLIGLGLALATVFIRRQRRLSDPLIDLKLFRSIPFSTSVGVNVLGSFVAFGSFLFTAQYLQLVLGLSPLRAGLWTLPSALGFIVTSMVVPRLTRYVRPAYLIAGGMVLVALSFALLGQAGGPNGLAFLVTGTVLMSLGLGPVFILNTDLIVSTAPPERAGAAAAISETGAEFGGVLGIAVLGSIGIAVYRGMVMNAVPDGLAFEAAEAARDTLGGAIAAVPLLPGEAGAGLLATSRDAFSTGFELIVLVCGMIAAGGAIIAAVLLRRVRTGAGATVREVAEPGALP